MSAAARAAGLAALLLVSRAILAAAEEPPWRTEGGRIRDGRGRVVVLRGANASNASKVSPFEPQLAPGEERLWARLGFNVVRLLLIWEAIEPEAGRFDADYLERIAPYLDRFHAAGVRVILDMHQDLWSRHRFGGDGAPAWAVLDLPHTPRQPWFLNYYSEAVQRNFDRFWTDADLQEHYARAWEEAVRRLASHPAVLGFDLMNEPHPGTAALGQFERERYAPWAKALADRLQKRAPDRLVFLEPVVTNGTRADLLAGAAGPGRVFAPHWYDPVVELGRAYPERDAAAPKRTRAALRAMTARAEKLGLPTLLGEWGMHPSLPGAAAYVRLVLDECDERQLSWCWWNWGRGDGAGYELLDQAGRPTDACRWIARAYPQRTAGTPERWSTDAATGAFDFAWRPDPAIDAPTEVAVPAPAFGEADAPPRAHTAGVLRTEWDAGRRLLRLWADPEAAACRVRVERQSD